MVINSTGEVNAAERIALALDAILTNCSLNNPNDMQAVVDNLNTVNEFALTHIFLRKD